MEKLEGEQRRNCFLQRGIYSSNYTYMRMKKETTKFYNKLYMKVNLPTDFNAKNITSTENLIFTKL